MKRKQTRREPASRAPVPGGSPVVIGYMSGWQAARHSPVPVPPAADEQPVDPSSTAISPAAATAALRVFLVLFVFMNLPFI
jgi:hypothetical protein